MTAVSVTNAVAIDAGEDGDRRHVQRATSSAPHPTRGMARPHGLLYAVGGQPGHPRS